MLIELVRPLLCAWCQSEDEADRDKLNKNLACRRLFLEANADPMLDSEEIEGSYYHNALAVGALVYYYLLW